MEWVDVTRGDEIPENAICGGFHHTDGMLYIGRASSGEVGKYNVSGTSVKNLWTHAGGQHANGKILTVPHGKVASWRAYNRGMALPVGAFLAGCYSTDGDLYVGRTGAALYNAPGEEREIGKLNVDGDKMKNLWCHATERHTSGQILVVEDDTDQTGFKAGDLLLCITLRRQSSAHHYGVGLAGGGVCRFYGMCYCDGIVIEPKTITNWLLPNDTLHTTTRATEWRVLGSYGPDAARRAMHEYYHNQEAWELSNKNNEHFARKMCTGRYECLQDEQVMSAWKILQVEGVRASPGVQRAVGGGMMLMNQEARRVPDPLDRMLMLNEAVEQRRGDIRRPRTHTRSRSPPPTVADEETSIGFAFME